MDDDRVPEILYGEAANLQNEPLEYILKLPISCATWKTDDQVEFDGASGDVYVNEDQFLFRCSSQSDHSVAIDAECILLHAQSEDQVLYLQLHEQPSNSDDGEVMEFTLTLMSSEDCERLFRALSHLVESHPVYGDDEDDLGTGGFSNGAMMMMGGEYGDDMIVAGSCEEIVAQQTPGEPSEEERNAMLDRLDAMLVVSPEFSREGDATDDGQFDDADDEIL
ncbi:hypothetical protein MHU86_15559 [Fragilaria crotonensis]|nr:hypothetical protein MHU86_15559 [Fragilaria crotonensis]